MQTLKEYLAIIIIAAIALFIEINFLHPEKYKSFRIIDYYDEEKESVVDGWFVSQSNETDEYLLLWIENARTTKINRLVSEDFEVVKADLIEKKHLKKYLEGIGITDRGLKKKAIEMRDSDVTRVDFDENCHLTYSTSGFSERPINLVIRKNILDNLSLGRFVITKEEVKAI